MVVARHPQVASAVDGADRRPLNGLVLSRDGRLAAAVSAVREVVVHRRLRQAELAFGAAWTGEAARTVALTVVAFRNGGATPVGIVALVRMVPSAFLAPVLTAAADGMRRERVLVLVS